MGLIWPIEPILTNFYWFIRCFIWGRGRVDNLFLQKSQQFIQTGKPTPRMGMRVFQAKPPLLG